MYIMLIMIKKEDEMVPIRVSKETRRKLNIISAKRDQTVEQTINYLIDFEYKSKKV